MGKFTEKEYTKDGETRYSNKFNEKELIDLKEAIDQAILEIQNQK